MKQIIRKIIKSTGYDLIKVENLPKEGSHMRSVGNMIYLLEDLKFRGLKCNSIIDVGANKCDWSRIAKRIFPDASFVLIEPQIELKNELELFCAQFKNSRYFLVGAGPENTKRILTLWDDLAGSSLLPKVHPELLENGKQREIEIVTIDNLMIKEKIRFPEIIKLDIQGFELEALKGAESTFGKTDVYILETSLFTFDDIYDMPVFSDVINFMLERDYIVYDFGGFMRRPYDGALGQCDICFVKRDGFFRKSNRWS